MPAPKSIVKVSPSPLLNFYPFGKDEIILQLATGEIEVFNFKKFKSVLKVDVAHTNQISKCRIHPGDPDLMATVGFDGFLKVWDLKTMKL